MINAEPGVDLDYLEIADAETLLPANENTKSIIVLLSGERLVKQG